MMKKTFFKKFSPSELQANMPLPIITTAMYFKNLPDVDTLKKVCKEKLLPLHRFSSIPVSAETGVLVWQVRGVRRSNPFLLKQLKADALYFALPCNPF